MSYVSDTDYVQMSSEALKIVQQSNDDRRANAETAAQEEISGYLRSRYDVTQVFAATGTNRNMQVVMYYCDIVPYNLVCSLPQKMGYELRKERYKCALEWLTKVQRGEVMPDLPLLTGDNGEEDINNPVRYSCGSKSKYEW